MAETSLLVTPEGQPVWRLVHEPQHDNLFGVTGVRVYGRRRAQTSDLAQALLQSPCQHAVCSNVQYYQRHIDGHLYIRWQQLRDQFPARDEGYGQAARALKKVNDVTDVFSICYVCGYRFLLVRFKLPDPNYPVHRV